MRAIDQFSAREWLGLLPVRQAWRQWRNDAWLLWYCQRRAEGLDAFLASARTLPARPIVAVIAFEQPWALGWLLDMAARHLSDANVLVFDNSRDPAARRDIARVCSLRGIPYLALPMNRTRHVNRSHGMAMSWVFDNVVRRLGPRVFGFIDHDLIPVRPVSIAERMGDQELFGMPVVSRWAWQLWAGYCFFDFSRVGALPLNFLYDFSRGLDTGGRNWNCLYSQLSFDDLRFAGNETIEVQATAGAPPTVVQIVDGRWLHIGGVSYNGNFRSKSEFCQALADRFEQGCTWEQVLARSPFAPLADAAASGRSAT